jgi:hypothetical protein
MPLERFYVTIEGHEDRGAAFHYGLEWLLGRPEKDLHIAFNSLENLREMLGLMQAYYLPAPQMLSLLHTLIMNKVFKFTDGKVLTVGLFHPRVQADPNAACLGGWVDTKRIKQIEKALGPAGAICAVPWNKLHIQDWIKKSSPHPVGPTAPGMEEQQELF